MEFVRPKGPLLPALRNNRLFQFQFIAFQFAQNLLQMVIQLRTAAPLSPCIAMGTSGINGCEIDFLVDQLQMFAGWNRSETSCCNKDTKSFPRCRIPDRRADGPAGASHRCIQIPSHRYEFPSRHNRCGIVGKSGPCAYSASQLSKCATYS